MTSNSISACQSSFYFYTITPNDICNAIHDLKESSAPRLDGIEIKFIKLASHILIYPLADLFNFSLCTCEIPAIWKSACITSLQKDDDTFDPNNYRPISIICSIAKVLLKNIFIIYYHSTLITIIISFLNINLVSDLTFPQLLLS